ncbi:MAG: hypothetical protein AAF919_17705 [Pseudomonadota bacterium]
MYEAALFAASLRHADPNFDGRLIVAEPQPGDLWPGDPRIPDGPVRELLVELGAEIAPFESRYFGADYPNGNKIEGLAALPAGEPFVFFDTDTAILAPLSEIALDPAQPAASMKRENTWPTIELYGPDHTEIWGALYARMGLELAGSLDEDWPASHWKRYLYFNAGWFFGADPAAFHDAFLKAALMIRDDPPDALVCQQIYPWLDQIALPLAIHALGGGRPGDRGGIATDVLDGSHSVHWRVMPLFYATASDPAVATVEAAAAPNRIKKVLKEYEPFRRFLYQNRGAKARALFDRDTLPRREQAIRNRLRREGLWMR